MKKYKVARDTFFNVDVDGFSAIPSRKYSRMMVFKKVLFWYFPLILKEYHSSPYDRALDKTVYRMDTNTITDIPEFFKDGKVRMGSVIGDKPFWYFYLEDKDKVNEEYYDTLDEFMDKNAERFI